MVKKIFVIVLCVLFAAGCFPGRSATPKKKRQTKIEGQAGRVIPGLGLAIDANYDPRLDNVVAGYKLLPVIVKNMSLRNIPMLHKLDRWVIVGEKGHRYQALNSLRHKDPRLWREIPERMQNMIDYPEIAPINYSVTFDLLMPAKANLEFFKEIRYYNAALGQELILEKEH